jgi:uncharacterized protein YlzI (FlbEa/FlbD family)
MIRVIRTDSQEILLNSNLIENISPLPEKKGTVVTLGTGEKVYVKNTQGDILQKMDAYRLGLAEARRQEERDKKKPEEKKK